MCKAVLYSLLPILLLLTGVPVVENKCSRLPSGNCWVNCMQNIFDVICNGVTGDMIRQDIAVFAETPQQLRLYIWSSPKITRLSAEIFSSVAKQILTVDLQDIVNLDIFPELFGLTNLIRFNVWNSPKLDSLDLELLPPSLYRIALNKVGVTHLENDFTDIPSLPNMHEFVLRNVTIKGWQLNFLSVFPNLTRLEISNSTFDFAEWDHSKLMANVKTINRLKLSQNTVEAATVADSTAFFGALIDSLEVQPGADVDVSMNRLNITAQAVRNMLEGFASAKQLNIRENVITAPASAIGVMLRGFSQLEELDMGDTNLQAIQGMFGGLPKLRRLILDHNQLVNMTTVDIFEGVQFTNLTYLDLSYNDINRFSPSDSYARIVAPQISYLNLRGNKLKDFLPSVEEDQTVINSFINLDTLILADNGIVTFSGRRLSNSSKLRVLDLSCNAIRNLTKEAFLGLNRRLEELDLSMCIAPPLTAPWIDWDAFTTLPGALKRLYLRSGRYKKWIFGVIKQSGMALRMLQELYLDDNDISFLLKTTIPELPMLRVLSLSRNALQSIGPLVFQSLPNLVTLLLNDNQIVAIGRNSFISMKAMRLDLSGNNLLQIEPGAFDRVPLLQSLMIGRNPAEVQDMFIAGGKNLNYLGIQGYNKSCLTREFFKSLPALHWILPDEYNIILVNPDGMKWSDEDVYLESQLQVCQIGSVEPDHEPYPKIPSLKNYVSVTIHDTDDGEGEQQYPVIAAFLPLNYCPVADYVVKLSNVICSSSTKMSA
ncbi:hypothetical protein BV898_09792 [Hypsibius exemplaris]|uniref:Insulin-like growth factor-binding protein complex acid labile subunit n=1 Tax=Hypsibius exemplaris TaxID=2072580 RepID=A0A1W0WLC7_HYPEX|nr:hypothetical protein BV898_09792 [Hypsibius exemplaris]